MSAVQKKRRVLLFSTYHSPFIDNDFQILTQFARVKHLITSGPRAVISIFWNIFSCDIVFCWFASVYSGIAVWFSRLIGKQTVVVIGGVDVATEYEIGYGIWLTRWKRPFVRHAIRQSDTVLVVDPSLEKKAKKLIQYDGHNIQYLPTGYKSTVWYPGKSKKRIVLTVASCDTIVRLKKKGIDFLLSASVKMPDVPFVLVGIDKTLFNGILLSVPSNVKLLPHMLQKDLLTYYQEAAVYCQPSRSEGLPNTLCEAMACGCIPVGTNVDGIPTAIGNTGFVVPFGDVELLVEALNQALRTKFSKGMLARQRIMEQFPYQRRVDGLKKVILGSECD